jgi:hypothetical protein
MMSGSGASTCGAEYGQAVTSRLTEVTTTTVPAGHRQPGGPDQELMRCDQVGFAWPQSNNVQSTQVQWRITAIFRAMATFAFFTPIRFASFIPQALREDHFFVRHRDKQLRVVLPALRFDRTYWMVTHANLHGIARVRAAIDFIVDEVRANRATFRQEPG